MKRLLLIGVSCLTISGMFLSGPAVAAGANKVPLRGPGAIVACHSNQPVPGENVSQAGPGFVIFNEGALGVVHANVALKDASPNTTYVVRLVQAIPSGGDCFSVDGLITTNGNGNGTLNIEEAKLAGATSAQVIVDTSGLFNTPTYRGSDLYPLS